MPDSLDCLSEPNVIRLELVKADTDKESRSDKNVVEQFPVSRVSPLRNVVSDY